MPDVLGFNPDRDLDFNADRGLGFDSDRSLGFDAERDLSFDADRDLPFGGRGVVFRGYVCPICGSSVTREQPTCTECGAVFEPKRPARPEREPPPAQPTPPAPPRRARPPRASKRPKRPHLRNCMFCGARVRSDDEFCWNCGNREPAGPGR